MQTGYEVSTVPVISRINDWAGYIFYVDVVDKL